MLNVFELIVWELLYLERKKHENYYIAIREYIQNHEKQHKELINIVFEKLKDKHLK